MASYMGQQGFLLNRPDSSAMLAERSSGSPDSTAHEFLDAAPLDLEIGAGVTHDARGAQMQEGRTTCASAMFDRALHIGVARGQIQAVGVEIIQVAAFAEIALDPATGVFTEMPMPLSSHTNNTGAGNSDRRSRPPH
jgi:stage V sporulation protein SpoVS